MNYFKNILVALDYQVAEQAEIDHSLALAKLHKAKITLMSVIPELSANEQLEISAMSPEERIELQISKRKLKLNETAGCLESKDVAVETIALSGLPSDEIVKQVIRGGHDLLVISEMDKDKSIKSRLSGSTTVQLIRMCPCPVWAIKPEQPEDYKHVMLTIDVREDKKTDNTALNNAILADASALAQSDHSELHLLSAPSTEDDFPFAMERIKKLLDANDVSIPEENIYLKTGDITSLIPAAAEEYKIDLLVMGMLSQTGIKGFFIGNTAEKILKQVDCSVLIIKPEEFVSPISLDD